MIKFDYDDDLINENDFDREEDEGNLNICKAIMIWKSNIPIQATEDDA